MKAWMIVVLAAVLFGVAAGTSGCFAKEPTLKGCSYDCSGGKPGARLYMSLSLEKDGTVRGVMETRRRHDEPTVRREMMVPREKLDEMAAMFPRKDVLRWARAPKVTDIRDGDVVSVAFDYSDGEYANIYEFCDLPPEGFAALRQVKAFLFEILKDAPQVKKEGV